VLVWLDLEMTGLDVSRHVIVEIATVITDDDLRVIAAGPDLIIGASEQQLAEMGDVVVAMHTASGLLERIATSTLTVAEAESATLNFLKAQGVPAHVVPLCGNSIGTDRRFLQSYMPDLERHFHYRNVDVSTIKELAQRWWPTALARRPEKATMHRALDDVYESIAELAFYRDAVFISPETAPTTTPLP
jgi:oligoribonuclease